MFPFVPIHTFELFRRLGQLDENLDSRLLLISASAITVAIPVRNIRRILWILEALGSEMPNASTISAFQTLPNWTVLLRMSVLSAVPTLSLTSGGDTRH